MLCSGGNSHTQQNFPMLDDPLKFHIYHLFPYLEVAVLCPKYSIVLISKSSVVLMLSNQNRGSSTKCSIVLLNQCHPYLI
jgi:hypothetical protein